MLRPWDLTFTINYDCERPIYRQIADHIIAAISEGRLHCDAALPGSRQLAAQLGVSRNTIVETFEVLAAEGWVETRKRRGTFVAHRSVPGGPQVDVNTKPSGIRAAPDTASTNSLLIDDGFPDSKLAPVRELAGAYRRIFDRTARWQMLGYGSPLGTLELRESIAQMLNFRRGMALEADNICITRGSQMAIFLAAACLIKPGDVVAVEHPGYKPVWQACEHAGAKLLPIPVDAHGLNVNILEEHLRSGHSIRVLYVTPQHQFPTTVTLGKARRTKLIQLSNHYNFQIIEDDYDHEFHFNGPGSEPLASNSDARHVVYTGSFSKILAPALRLGFLVARPALINKVANLRKIIDAQGDVIMEQAVLELMRSGSITRHLRDARRQYLNKRNIFGTALQQHFAGHTDINIPDGGLAYWLKLSNIPALCVDGSTKVDGAKLQKSLQHLHMAGFDCVSPLDFSLDGNAQGLRLGYASRTAEQLELFAKALAQSMCSASDS